MSAYILNAAKTMRNLKLKCGWGVAPFAYLAAGQRSLSFQNTSNDPSSLEPIDLKPGETFYMDSH